jgi:C-terminal processing protease CtpA/Prc
MRGFLLVAAAGLLSACGLLGPDIPESRLPLSDMEEPLELFEEPDDEALRRSLAAGVFTGIYVKDAAQSLEEMDAEGGPGVVVTSIVENSPGEAAGFESGDLLYEVFVNDRAEPVPLPWASAWRALELEGTPGDTFRIPYERAGAEREATLTTVRRMSSGPRNETERFREEEKVGLVVRTATEVEARHAGLGPGGGAIVVGLSRRSPWRTAGLRFEDLIVAVNGKPVAHPQVVLDVIRETPPEEVVVLDILREDTPLHIEAPVSEREGEISSFTIPLLFSHESTRNEADTSLLLGLLGYRETEAAWEFRILWFIRLTGGDTDQLKEVEVEQ